jgi:ketol-acid reductoisomerase
LHNEGKKLEGYFTDKGYQTIAIYGMGELGNRLYEELKDSNVKIKYAIDKNSDSTYSELDVISIEDEMEAVDAVVVTAFFAFDEIKEELEQSIEYPIISIEDVIYEL